MLPCWAGKLLPPRFSGDKLIRAASAGNSPLTVEGYLAGVVDTAQGKALCFAQTTEASELYSIALDELRKLPQTRLRENASTLIVETLREKFSCGKENEQLMPPKFEGIHLSQAIATSEGYAIANGYLAGVADATRGKAWCLTKMIKPPDVDSKVFGELRKLPQERLHENASTLITEALRQHFPCK